MKIASPIHIASKVIVPAAAALAIAAPLAAFAQTTVTDTSINQASQATVTVNGQTVSADVNANVNGGASTTGHVKGEGVLTNGKSRADEEISRRITNLTSLSTRIGEMKNISVNEKSTLQTSITTEINNLTTLKATIDASTDVTTLKTDIQSITKDYRIYMLVIPQGRIMAAADRIETIVADMQGIAPKLQARITEAQTAGKDVTAANAAYADMQAKIADANTQATAAATEVANLTPDQGDTTTESSNTAAVKDAASKIKTATADLKAARADITTIMGAVKGTGSATASTSASANVQ